MLFIKATLLKATKDWNLIENNNNLKCQKELKSLDRV